MRVRQPLIWEIQREPYKFSRNMNLFFRKSSGQNFLIDTHVLDKIINAGEITKEDFVLEIGPGIETMTPVPGLCSKRGLCSRNRQSTDSYFRRYSSGL